MGLRPPGVFSKQGSIPQVGAKIGNFTFADSGAPLIEFPDTHFPERAAFFEILENRIALAALKEALRKRHVREAIPDILICGVEWRQAPPRVSHIVRAAQE
jgi:hypothetical protein